MTGPGVVLRAAAQRDLQTAAGYYLSERGVAEAARFTRAVEVALRHIATHPHSGSSRYGQELRLPGLRSWPVAGPYPYLVFYLVTGARIDVGRILHTRRDIPASLRGMPP